MKTGAFLAGYINGFDKYFNEFTDKYYREIA